MLSEDYLALKLVRLEPNQNWVLKPEELQIIFPKGGIGEHVTGGLHQKLVPGDVLVARAMTGGRVHAPAGARFVFNYFSLSLERLFPLFSASEMCLLRNLYEQLDTGSIYPASSPVAMECHHWLVEAPPRLGLDHRAHLLKIAGCLLALEFKTGQSHHLGSGRAAEHLFQVFEKLSAAEILNLSVPELAERFSCSRRHLNRLFQQHFGVSVASLRMEMRMLKAVSLLRDPDCKIISIAEDCGFNHLGLFNTCFKRRFGVSPGQWRKQPSGEMSEEVVYQGRGKSGMKAGQRALLAAKVRHTSKGNGFLPPNEAGLHNENGNGNSLHSSAA